MSIFYRNVVDSPAINTHPPSSIILRHKQHRHRAWAHALSHMSFGQQLLNLPLKFLYLLRITPIGWLVGNCRTWHKINLMLYSSNRWQSTSIPATKIVKFVNIKTYLFVQEYKYRLVCIKKTFLTSLALA